MAEIIRRRERHEETVYSLSFHWRNDEGSGFSFPCDKDGNVEDKWKDAPNYLKCINGEHDVVPDGVRSFTHHWFSPTVIRCSCGEEVELHNFTNTCHRCHADYNMSGQRLAPRSQWGEETGEHWTDCV